MVNAGQLQIESSSQLVMPRADYHNRLTNIEPILEVGCVHELLTLTHPPRAVAAWLSRPAEKAIAWCERDAWPYPPALAMAGLSPAKVFLLRPQNDAQAHWVVTEALRCSGVGVTVAMTNKLTPVQARRFQLAAERGGGVGLLIRRVTDAAVHAARTRWLVQPERGDLVTQRWRLRLIHGHGRLAQKDLLLEVDRETNRVRAAAVLADRPYQASPAVVAV